MIGFWMKPHVLAKQTSKLGKTLHQRLLTDYKEGKAFSYYDMAKWGGVFPHPIITNSKSQYKFCVQKIVGINDNFIKIELMLL